MVYTKQALFKCTKRNLATRRDDLPLVLLKLFTKKPIIKKTIIYKIPRHPVTWKAVLEGTFEVYRKWKC